MKLKILGWGAGVALLVYLALCYPILRFADWLDRRGTR